MFITSKHLSRRTVLRGLGGTALALPFLDAMVPAASAQARAAAAPPLRFGAVYFPHGALPANWIPKGTGAGFQFSEVLSPLEPFRNQLTVVSGLSTPPPGGHATASAMFLNDSRPRAAAARGTVTVDQLIAEKIAGDTVFRSLELGTEDMSASLGSCQGLPCVYLGVLAWRSETTPLPVEINPRALFERLFGDTGEASGRRARLEMRRSMLDSITDSAKRLLARVDANDGRVVTDYLDAIRDVERQIQASEQRVASDPNLPEAPGGIPESFEPHVKLMYDMGALALRADLTRVFTFLVAHEGSQRSYPEVGVTEGHHSISHHRDDPGRIEKWTQIGRFHCQLFSNFVKTLSETPDGDGTLLDHSMLLYGSGLGNANVHDSADLPSLVVGGACGQIAGNRHLAYPNGTPTGNLLVSLAQKAGVELDRLGFSNGTIDL